MTPAVHRSNVGTGTRSAGAMRVVDLKRVSKACVHFTMCNFHLPFTNISKLEIKVIQIHMTLQGFIPLGIQWSSNGFPTGLPKQTFPS